MNKSVINSYRLQPGPVQSPPSPGVIAGRIIPAVTSANDRRALVVLAVILLPLLAVGVVVYAAQATRPAPVAVLPVPPPVAATPVVVVQERVVEVTAPPVIIIVTVTPPPISAQPVQVAPVAPRQAAPQPQARPVQAQAPAVAPAARPVQAQASPRSAPAPTMGPQERLLSRPCQFPDAPQGTIIRGYYTDASGVKRDAVCRFDGWKAVD